MLSAQRILVVEDDALTRNALQGLLESEGYVVQAVPDGTAALSQLHSGAPDLVLLDRGLPDADGLDVCRLLRTRANGSGPRIIMLTGYQQPDHVLQGFDAGADDYVLKPYSSGELLARVQANLRRRVSSPVERRPPLVVDPRLTVDWDEQVLMINGQVVRLSPTECALLRVLVENAGQVVLFDTILQRVWGPLFTDAVHYVHLYVTYLRKKLEPDPHHPRYIFSERRVGYRFRPLTDEAPSDTP